MLNEQTISILHSLRLFGLARGFEGRLADPKTGFAVTCRFHRATGAGREDLPG